MRVSVFTPDFRAGGAEKMMVHLANQFSKNGLDTDLVVADKFGPYVTLVEDSVNLVDLGCSFANPIVLLKLTQHFRKRKPHIFLSPMTYPNIAALIAKKIACSNAKLVFTESTNTKAQVSNSTLLKERLKPIIMKRLYPFSDRVVAVSDGVKNGLLEILNGMKNSVVRIYNPVVTKDFFRQRHRPDHPFFKEGNPKIILAAGRLVKVKDFETLIHAFCLLTEQVEARLLIMGDGPERERLGHLVCALKLSEHVDFLGYVGDPAWYMQHSDLLAMSSIWEGFGNVLVEAMASGCNVVSTNCDHGPSEILRGGDFGELVPIRDPTALSEAMIRTLKYPVDKRLLIDRALDFSVEMIADRYVQLFNELLAEN